MSMLTALSGEMADAIATAAPAVVQVLGRRRPVSGLVHSDGVVVTTTGQSTATRMGYGCGGPTARCSMRNWQGGIRRPASRC